MNFEIIDNIGYSVANADFKYCYTYDDETACPIINSAAALNESSKYRTYNPHADLREISNCFLLGSLLLNNLSLIHFL